MIVLTRIDNRLIHGQVIEAWVPHLKVRRLVVADDTSAGDPMARAVMTMAVPQEVDVVLEPVGGLDFAAMARDAVPTMVLFRDVAGVVSARAHGLPTGPLNLGNVHAGPGRVALSRSVYLSADDRSSLATLQGQGMLVTAQAVPSEKPVPLPQ